jgi:transposase-like protein
MVGERKEFTMAEERKRYTREFKIEAVRLLESSGKNGRAVEEELGIGSGQIYRWRKQLEAEGKGAQAFPGTGRPRDEEMARLKRENAVLREERDILRKAVAIFSRHSR